MKIIALFLLFPIVIFSQNTYWQQEVNYKIEVELDDHNHHLNGFEEIEYTNNSPSTLDSIVFHIWPNAYKNSETALGQQLLRNGDTELYYASEKMKGHIDSLNFRVNGESIKWSFHPLHIDICTLHLRNPLQPGDKILITTPFHIKLPSGSISRLGHIGQSYQITQWYPKPAVFNSDGWQAMPYLNQGEFFSEYGSFDVSITLPENYRIGATGDLIGPSAEKEIAFKDSIANITKTITTFEGQLEPPKSSEKTKTLHFHQENVHDFGWFADKRWHILKGEVKLPNSGKTVTTWAMFTNAEAHLWKSSIEYLNDATYYYSLWNGDYQYKHVTAVDGTISAGGGMEYPNVTVIGTSGTPFGLETVIMHEVGHNWFYGMLGSNERTNAWMDEGINSYNEKRYIQTKYPNANLMDMMGNSGRSSILGKQIPMYDNFYNLQYLVTSRAGLDQPMQLHSADFTSGNYGTIVYAKSAASLNYLSKFLGQKMFDKCMKQYFKEWKFKHPEPKDLQDVFERVSKQNLDWFFHDLIQSNEILDYKIVSFDSKSDTTTNYIRVQNKGDLNAPFSITSFSKTGKAKDKVWYNGFEGEMLLKFPKGDYKKLVIDAKEESIEIYKDNNRLRTSGILKKVEPLKFEFLGNLENPRYNQVFWSPIIGWNQIDRTMIGFSLYNSFLPSEKFTWHFMPLLSNTSQTLLGSYSMEYRWFKVNHLINRIAIGNSFKRYAYNGGNSPTTYNRNLTYLLFNFKSKVRSNIKQSAELRNYSIKAEFTDQAIEGISDVKSFSRLDYHLINKHPLHEQSLRASLDLINQSNRISAEYNVQLHYPNLRRKKLNIRLFAGSFIGSSSSSNQYRFRLSSWGNTSINQNDFYLDHFFFNRNNSNKFDLFSKQMVLRDGGFINHFFYGQSKWMTSANLHFDSPIPFIKGVFNVAYLPNTFETANDFVYEGGLKLTVIKNMFEVYVPLFAHQTIQSSHDALNLNFLQSIRFTLHLEKIKLYKLDDLVGLN